MEFQPGVRKGFTIIWRIENYNFFFEKSGIGFYSPLFVINFVKNTSWKLRIVANSVKKKGYFVFEVIRCLTVNTSLDLELDFEISVNNDQDTTQIFEKSYTHTYRSSSESLQCYLRQNQIYCKNGNELSLPKVLTIRCRMFKREGSFSETGHCFARSRIRVERTAFIGFTEKFSCLFPGERKFMTIKSVAAKKPDLNLNLTLRGDFCCKENVWIEITPIEKDYIKYCKCKLFLLNSEGEKINCGRSEILFSETDTQEWKFPLNFTKDYIMRRNTQFLSNDNLSLKCEFAFSTGIEYEEIEDSEVDNITALDKNQPRKLPSALEDITCMYNKGILCDMKLRTEKETFNVHKIILSARSPIFEKMFTTNMKEKEINCVCIEDLDANTVRQMLLFLYSDNLKDLDLESAKKLYYAADKYNIIALKHRCSCFLKMNLEIFNCCEILLSSDRHQDVELKKAAQEFISHNRDDILYTDQWVNFEKSNPVLAIDTLRAMCVRK